MNEIEDADDDINDGKLLFIGSNKETFNFNTFRKPLNFISAIYNGEITLKKAEFKQREIKKIEDLRGYKNNAEKEKKEEINGVLMQADDLLGYRNNIIKAFKDGTFMSEHLKKSDDAAYKHVLKDVSKFMKEIRSMEEKINLSLFDEFFESPSPADYAKTLINIKNTDEKQEIVEEIENRISDLKDKIKKMSEKEKNDKNVDETLKIIRKILDYNKEAQKVFIVHQKLIKENQNQILKKLWQRE